MSQNIDFEMLSSLVSPNHHIDTDVIKKRFEKIPDREKYIIVKRLEGLALSQIAEIFPPMGNTHNSQNKHGVTTERIRQLLARALQRIKKMEVY